MMIQDKLLLLEEKLEKLLAEYNAVKQERDLLLEKNNSLLIHIGNIETENSLLKQNKEIVRKRIENMLIKLESYFEGIWVLLN